MFGGVPESGYRAPYTPHPMIHPGLDTAWRMPRPPSPGLVAQRAIREQQVSLRFLNMFVAFDFVLILSDLVHTG